MLRLRLPVNRQGENCLGTTEKHRNSEINVIDKIVIDEKNNKELTMNRKGIKNLLCTSEKTLY
jgi:hypothetical protein